MNGIKAVVCHAGCLKNLLKSEGQCIVVSLFNSIFRVSDKMCNKCSKDSLITILQLN